MIVEFIKALIRFLTYLSIIAFIIYVMTLITNFHFLGVVLLLFCVILFLCIAFLIANVIVWAFDIYKEGRII